MPRKQFHTSKATGMRKIAVGFILLFSLIVLALPGQAKAWWNDSWTLRKKVTIDTSAAGANIADAIGRVPVLIRLSDGSFPFAHVLDNGNDLRFVADDDETPLAFHIEKFDPLLGMGFAWVNIPHLKPGAKTDIWIYYGNRDANAANDPKGTYDPDTLTVYHFAEHGTPPQDATAYSNNAQTAGRTADGAIIGDGLRLDGATPITLSASPSLATPPGGATTLSFWVKMDAAQDNAVIYAHEDGGNQFLIGIDRGVPFVRVATPAGAERSAPGPGITEGSWHHLAMTASDGGLTLYLDGVPNTTLAVALPALSGAAILGGVPATATTPAATTGGENGTTAAAASHPQPAHAKPTSLGNTPNGTPAQAAATPIAAAPAFQPFVGDIDEFHVSRIARSPAFLQTEIAAEGPGGRLVTLSSDEETSSWLSGYFAILLNAVTIDGWVVISICIAMAIVSWFVMANKASMVHRQVRANRAFLHLYERTSGNLGLLHSLTPEQLLAHHQPLSKANERLLRHSSLYQLFHTGGLEIRQRFSGEEEALNEKPGAMSTQPFHRVLEPHSIAAMRARLDAGMVREGQKLNRNLVLLTIAISGGPFLGLLGTVVGVMITFAAVAAAGDVNVNAIAPGIAAALVATVAGLTVAIPALFGYNYLLTRIKDITADMRVFSDEFITRVAEIYRPSAHSFSDQLATE